MIITKLLSSCVIQTYVTNPASQEMPWKRSKYKTPPPSTVWHLKLCHYSGFPLPSPLIFFLHPPQHHVPHPLHFLWVTSSPLWFMSLNSQGVQRIRDLLSVCWALMPSMRAGCCSQRQKRRWDTFSLWYHGTGMLQIQSSPQDTWNLCSLRAGGVLGNLRCQTQHSYSARVQVLLSRT